MNNNFYINNLNRNKTLLIPSFCYHERLSINIKFKDIFFYKRFEKKYHGSTINKCFWSKISDILNKNAKIYKMDIMTNNYLKQKNKNIFDFYFKKEYISKLQYKAFYANNNKLHKIFEHRILIIEREGKFYALPLTSKSGWSRKLLNIEEIKKATPLSFQHAQLVKFKSFLDKFFTPVAFELGDEKDIVLYNFKEIETISDDEILNYIKLHEDVQIIFSKLSLKDYIEPSESLKIVSQFNTDNNKSNNDENQNINSLKIINKEEP